MAMCGRDLFISPSFDLGVVARGSKPFRIRSQSGNGPPGCSPVTFPIVWSPTRSVRGTHDRFETCKFTHGDFSRTERQLLWSLCVQGAGETYVVIWSALGGAASPCQCL